MMPESVVQSGSTPDIRNLASDRDGERTEKLGCTLYIGAAIGVEFRAQLLNLLLADRCCSDGVGMTNKNISGSMED
jgi:hypothetical protein